MDLGTQHPPRLFRFAGAEDAQFLVELRPFLVLPPLAACEKDRVGAHAEFQPVVCQCRPVFVVRMGRNIHEHAVMREVKKGLA
jgi:hypothetical protein